MSNYSALERLLFMDKGERKAALQRALQRYARLLSSIGKDIYDSCIQDYYAQYDPIKYDRHGYPEGQNLYNAIDAWADGLVAGISLQEYKLWPYKGKQDKRGKVLSTVLDGYRGAGSSKSPPGWPMSWSTCYPNEYSKFYDWESGMTTLDDILIDFTANAPADLENKFYEFLEDSV